MAPSLSYSYQALLKADDTEEGIKPDPYQILHQKNRRCFSLILALTVSAVVNLFFAVWWLQCQGHGCSFYPQLTQTPAGDALSYKTMSFSRGLEEESIYERDPSPTVNAAWRALYEFSNSTLPGQDRIPSFKESLEFIKQKGTRIRLLDVFHQLHCLDTIRQAFYPEYYATHHIDSGHVMHCINSIRQSLMCMADISVVEWEWDQNLDILIEKGGNMHTCRDFEKIREWASQYHYDRQFITEV